MTALTDQAIAKIKNLIMSGEFAADSKLPKEADLAQRLGLSRNSLREAVRALSLIGVLEPRVGDGTYVTSLEPELLLTGMGFVSDLLTGPTLLELHQVRRILEPVATGMAAARLDEDDFAALEACLADMDAAETTQAFIAADAGVPPHHRHRLGQRDARLADPEPLRRHAQSPPLALGQGAGRDRDDEAAPLGHLPRAARPRRGTRERRRSDPPLRGRAVAPAADRERGRARRPRRTASRRRDPRVTAVYYEGEGRFAIGESERLRARPGRGSPRRRLLRRLRHRPPHRPRPHGRGASALHRVIGHEMSGTVAELGPGVDGLEPGDAVVVRPLDTRGETAADKGFSHISRNLKFMGIDSPGAFQQSWTVPAFTIHKLPPGLDLRLAALAEPLAVACHDTRRGEVAAGESVVVIGGGPIGLLIGLVARSLGADVVLSEVNASRRSLADEPRAGRRRSGCGRSAARAARADRRRRSRRRLRGLGLGCGRRADDRARLHPRARRRGRDLPGAAAGAALRRLLEGAHDRRRARLRAGRLRAGDRPARRGHPPARRADHRRSSRSSGCRPSSAR